MDSWTKRLDSNDGVDVIYTDFEKAFDKVPHKRLLFKLKKYGICRAAINWVTEYLTNRRHRVKLNNKTSEWREVKSRIPQGSVLGPLLFIIFINDMPENCGELVDTSLYADDAKLSKKIHNDNDRMLLQQALDKSVNWSRIWLLPLNVLKCIVLNIRKSTSINSNYCIHTDSGDVILKNVENVKDLGILVDQKLTFVEHVHEKVNKANCMLGLIKKKFQIYG
jgi:hypothetical protein